MTRFAFQALALFLMSACTSMSSASEPHAVILLYHHVSEQTPASTSVTPAQFEQHLEYLAANDYRVWPLQRVLDSLLQDAENVPDRLVAITFDDAYESVHMEAHPRLAERDWPYTVFVNTEAVDAGHSPYMSWAQLRALADEGVAIENHSAAHGHMSRPRPSESQKEWRQRVRADIGTARSRIAAEIGRAPELFAYPYGEDSAALAEIVAEDHGYALAQRSGPVGPLTDLLSIPRFPMATGFASMDRLQLAVRSRPLPVSQRAARPGEPAAGGDIDRIELQLQSGDFRAARLDCFAGSGRRLDTEIVGDGPYRVLIDLREVGSPGRNKVNCTAPAADGSGEYYWFSYQWLVDRG